MENMVLVCGVSENVPPGPVEGGWVGEGGFQGQTKSDTYGNPHHVILFFMS